MAAARISGSRRVSTAAVSCAQSVWSSVASAARSSAAIASGSSRASSRLSHDAKPGAGDSVANVVSRGSSRGDLGRHLFDQEAAERDAGQPALAVRDRIEDRGGRALGRDGLAPRREDRRHRFGHLAGERDLDEDQRLVDQRRVEEGVAAPIGRIDAVAQVAPVVDLVHRLVLDDLLQDVGGRRPVDPAQHQEAAVEPRREQVDEVGVDRRKVVAMVHGVHQTLAHRHQRLGAAWREIEAPQQLLPTRLGGAVQLGGGDVVRCLLPGVDGAADALEVGPEPVGERLEEGDARAGGELGEAQQNVARERGAGRLAAHRDELLAQVDQVLGVLGGGAATAGAVDERTTAIGDALQQLAEEGRIHVR